jgi:hypothetical protein
MVNLLREALPDAAQRSQKLDFSGTAPHLRWLQLTATALRCLLQATA